MAEHAGDLDVLSQPCWPSAQEIRCHSGLGAMAVATDSGLFGESFDVATCCNTVSTEAISWLDLQQNDQNVSGTFWNHPGDEGNESHENDESSEVQDRDEGTADSMR